MFLASVFGPALEEAALALHREGIPYQQAMDAVCGAFTKELSKTVAIPGRVGFRMRAIVALQASLRRTPARRPASIAARPEFVEALVYLRLTAESAPDYRDALEWWEAFISGNPVLPAPEAAADGPTGKKRRRRRGKRRRGHRGPPTPSETNTPS